MAVVNNEFVYIWKGGRAEVGMNVFIHQVYLYSSAGMDFSSVHQHA